MLQKETSERESMETKAIARRIYKKHPFQSISHGILTLYEMTHAPFSSEGGLLAFSISAISISKILAILMGARETSCLFPARI